MLQQLNSVALVHIAAHGHMETVEIFLAPNPERTDSGRGQVKSQGVIGIARAFLAAGARSVLVSLWAIEDEATIEFMRSFYQHLVLGRTTGEALKKAMECLIESERFNHPTHWASIVLIGDDFMLEFSEKDV